MPAPVLGSEQGSPTESPRLDARRSSQGARIHEGAIPGYTVRTARNAEFSLELASASTFERLDKEGGATFKNRSFSIVYTLIDGGVKEDIILHDASAPTTYRFRVARTGGMTARSAMGGLAFGRRGYGDEFYVFPPVANDAAGRDVPVIWLRDEDKSEWAYEVVVAPTTRFPVTVDPIVIDTSPDLSFRGGSQRSMVRTRDEATIIGSLTGSTLRLSSGSPPNFDSWVSTNVLSGVANFALALDRDNYLWIAYETTATPPKILLGKYQREATGSFTAIGSATELAANGRAPSISVGRDNTVWVSFDRRQSVPFSVDIRVQKVAPVLEPAIVVADLTLFGGSSPASSSIVATGSGMGLLYNNTSGELFWRWSTLSCVCFGTSSSLGPVTGGLFSVLGRAGAGDVVEAVSVRTLTAGCGVYYTLLDAESLLAFPDRVNDEVDCTIPDAVTGISISGGLSGQALIVYPKKVGDKQHQLRQVHVRDGELRTAGSYLEDEDFFSSVKVQSATGLVDRTNQAITTTPGDVTFGEVAGDQLYVGLGEKFDFTRFTLSAPASVSINPTFDFSTGSGWESLSVTDGTLGFTRTGSLTFTPPAGWQQQTVGGHSAFWLRVTRGALVAAPPSASQITPIRENKSVAQGDRLWLGRSAAWLVQSEASALIEYVQNAPPPEPSENPCAAAAATKPLEGKAISLMETDGEGNGFVQYLTTGSVTFSWWKYPDASSYRLEFLDRPPAQECWNGLGDYDENHMIMVDVGNVTSYTRSVDWIIWNIASGTLWWRVQAKNALGQPFGLFSRADQFTQAGIFAKWTDSSPELKCRQDASWPSQWTSELNNVLNAWEGLETKLRVSKVTSGSNCTVRRQSLTADGPIGQTSPAFVPGSNHPRSLSSTLVDLNSDVNFSILKPTQCDCYDVVSVLLHEVGHATGVSHDANNSRANLFPSIAKREQRREFAHYDAKSLPKAYGSR